MRKSVWQDSVNMPHFPKLEGDIKTDVLIVGGGITGVLTAFFLQQKGVKYILAEKERICQGVTANTTAKITAQHGFIYDKISNSYGKETAALYLKANNESLLKYTELAKQFPCDLEIMDNCVYTLNSPEKAEKEIKALEKISYKVDYTEKTELPFKIAAAVKFKNQAQFNPLKLLSEISKGLNIYENTFIKELGKGFAVTDSGKITAKKIIIATHFPILNKHGSYFIKLYQYRSYVLALSNAIRLKGMYVDESDNGLSFRSYGNLLLLGGGGHRTGKNGGNWKKLGEFKRVNFKEAKEEYRWATQDCISLDRIPYIGKYSKNTNELYVATGFNKWGMTTAMTAAGLLSDMVTETENEYEKVFNPSRSILKPQLLVNGLEATVNLIAPAKKRCPHLGCGLKWNSAEHSWDCPCHGSRFSRDGKLLDNPANGDMKM